MELNRDNPEGDDQPPSPRCAPGARRLIGEVGAAARGRGS